MCIAVTLAPGTLLTLDEVIKMERSNRDGVGIAWAEDGLVHWIKSANVDPHKVWKILENQKDFPRLLHFRLSTAGGIRNELCHPFEIGPLASTAISGSTKKMMIHNGHWGGWEDIKRILEREDLLPEGPWSDTRLVAYLAHQDEEWLEALTGKVATLNGAGEIGYLGTWETLREGIKISNRYWENNSRSYASGADRHWKGWGGVYEGESDGQAGGQGEAKEEAKDSGKEEKRESKETKSYRNKPYNPNGIISMDDPKVGRVWYSYQEECWQYFDKETKTILKITSNDPLGAVRKIKAERERERAGGGKTASNGAGGVPTLCEGTAGSVGKVEKGNERCGYHGARNCLAIEHNNVHPCTTCPYTGE